MKTISWHPSRRRSGSNPNILHIEAEGCIVNIHVGLTDALGCSVTRVSIIPDRYAGEEWTVDGPQEIRVRGPYPIKEPR